MPALTEDYNPPFFLWKHLNKLRWVSLTLVFLILILLPYIAVYQTFLSAHAYDLLPSSEKVLYDTMEMITDPFVSDPRKDLDAVKGSTWSATFFSFQISDPLAVLSHSFSSTSLYWPFILTAFIPVFLTLIFGRFFCGWICPATFIYELNTNLGLVLEKLGLKTGRRHLDKRIKYAVLIVGLLMSVVTGSVLMAAIYPPAIIGRELYYAIALGGFGSGAVFFLATMMFDLLVARRGFCRYICPGGALYSLLGRYRLVRIKRIVSQCNDCAKCNAVCEFDLNPLRDDFGQECNNCTACIASCPTDAMTLIVSTHDTPPQGPGHLGKSYKSNRRSNSKQATGSADNE